MATSCQKKLHLHPIADLILVTVHELFNVGSTEYRIFKQRVLQCKTYRYNLSTLLFFPPRVVLRLDPEYSTLYGWRYLKITSCVTYYYTTTWSLRPTGP